LLRWLARSPLTARDATAVLGALILGGPEGGADVAPQDRTWLREEAAPLTLDLLAKLAARSERDVAARALALLHQLVYAIPLVAGTDHEALWLASLQHLASLGLPAPAQPAQSTPSPSASPSALALAHLQRALLAPPLFALGFEAWVRVFERLLFPMVDALLRLAPQPGALDGHEEERLRASALLCKTLVQYVAKFVAHGAAFGSLWFQVLTRLEAFVAGSPSDLLLESVTQAARNLLLVVHAAALLDNAAWLATWERLDRFAPRLRADADLATLPGAKQPSS
jgi:hypothetical protein